MDGTTEKEVIYSNFIKPDLQEIFNYGMITFGYNQAELYILNLTKEISLLQKYYLLHPQCRRLETKSKIYRNIIIGSHLVIYRINHRVEVLRIIHSSSGNLKIKKIRQIQVPE